MAQKKTQIKPLFISTDVAFEEMKAHQSPYIRGMQWSINANPVSEIGTNNPTGEGQNELVQSTVRSNTAVPNVLLPTGYNKHIGSFESTTTQELYHFNYNINGNHGIYVLNGNTGLWQKVIVDRELGFTDNQENYIANHRVLLRFVQDKDANIIEKYLLITEGNTWQKYINVIAAIRTNGFDVTQYPYWTLRQPHFDRRELLEWPVRPPMIKPEIATIDNTTADTGKINRFVDQAFQVAYSFQNTDGRPTTLSPYSLPLLIKSEDFLNNPDSLPKNARITMYAGSPLTEKIMVYVRRGKKGTNTLPSIENWTDWYLYDVINRFPNSSSSDVLGTDYWLRSNQWAQYSYDNVFNTLQYTFDLSKVQQIVNQDDANMIQTGIPQLSVAMTDLGDAALLGDNRYGYPNFGDDIMNKFSVEVVEKADSSCSIKLRRIRLYAYIARCGDDFTYTSQVGYYNGTDTQMRFGGVTVGGSATAHADVAESKSFKLDFADKKALRCYLKGTPYYADGVWYQVNSDNSLVKLPNDLNLADDATKVQVQDVFVAGGYFVCVFDIDAPAGKYIACLGRHDVPSSGDYRGTSTYVYGIANSRVKSQTSMVNSTLTSIKPNAINGGNGVVYSKEMEIDCTAGNVDVWGNNHDLFYVYCPYITQEGNKKYRFIEGYFKESITNPLSVEMFPYRMDHSATDDCGQFTDKNGFYWSYTKVANADRVSIEFYPKVNCAYPTVFLIATSSTGSGWKQNATAYLADHNGGQVGFANRILYNGKITSINGLVNYSNIAISIKDGATVLSRSDGTFTLIVHNGMGVLRVSNVYVNAGGNFFITIANCGQVPLYNFDETLVPCIYPTNAARTYPIPLNLAVNISSDRQTSVKEGGIYNIGFYGADLAGRVMYVNVKSEIPIPTFLQRDNLKATYFRWLIANTINFVNYPDIRWITPCVSKDVSKKRYLDWIGDEISYIDNNGKTVTDVASAVFVSIKINSLYNSNLAKNFSLLSTYQFVKGDRIRILDDGDGNLFDVATYGSEMNFQILGTNYLQAAIDSGLLPPSSNTVLSTTPTTPDVTLIVRYDPRLDKLLDKKGFWIETYTPTEESDIIPFYEDAGFYPIVNGQIVRFTGFTGSQPNYVPLTSVDLNFWDTYFFDRSITIPNVGNKYFSHPFQSANVTDNWGADIISGGRNNIKNENARQYWLPGETTKSNDFLKEGIINGLATFNGGNKKDFGSYPAGAITALHSERNMLIIVCENDWYITDYNFHRAFLNEQGILVANLDDGLSSPHQKVGSIFGMSKADTGTFIVYDKEVYWWDRKNESMTRCNYQDANDTTIKTESEQGGMHSYAITKTNFVTVWNNAHGKENSFDIIAGIDVDLGKIYVTFRCRRNNSNVLSSYINDRRNWQLNFQETIVYDTVNRGWLRAEGFAPEGYGSLRGDATGTQLVTFAAGKPYLHNSEKTSFNKYYGIQTMPVVMGIFNEENSVEKIFDAMYYSTNPSGWFVDYIYTDFKNSFSTISLNQFKRYLNTWYAAILRNYNSYPTNNPDELFRSNLMDGYRMKGKYCILRMVGDYQSAGEYKELGVITGVIKADESNKK